MPPTTAPSPTDVQTASSVWSTTTSSPTLATTTPGTNITTSGLVPGPTTPASNPVSINSVAIGAGVGVPVAALTVVLLVFILLRARKQRRKQAEEKVKEPTKREAPLRWSKTLLDSTTIHELNGHGTAQEFDSTPVGAIEIGSNQIYEARDRRDSASLEVYHEQI
ncbi:MAG: hypothetical protein Q9218_005067 [Villophora microphyllina]